MSKLGCTDFEPLVAQLSAPAKDIYENYEREHEADMAYFQLLTDSYYGGGIDRDSYLTKQRLYLAFHSKGIVKDMDELLAMDENQYLELVRPEYFRMQGVLDSFSATKKGELEQAANSPEFATKVRQAIADVANENDFAAIFDIDVSLFHGGLEDVTPLVKSKLGL